MTEPTDAEIWQMWMPMVRRMGVADPVEFARAVLAKWGTPPAVAGEPVGYCHEIKWRAHQSEQVQKITQKAQPEYGYTQALYTKPQAGAVPMTPEQRDALWESCKYDDGEEWTVNREQIVDAVERHHRIGIKGGQHG